MIPKAGEKGVNRRLGAIAAFQAIPLRHTLKNNRIDGE
jgi:hypothetical protein